jgi:4-amino-4-deoxy-L-arabinose transferase-like glycosyltransferase
MSGESHPSGAATIAAGPVESPTRAWWKRPLFGVGIPLVVGLLHVALVAPHYFVGSFDDDANYILTARALLAGQGLTGHVTSGAVVAGLYPPGYSALIAPLLWIWPHTYVPLRLLSVICYGLVFVLTWVYMGRRRVSEGIRVAALGLLALGPPLATFGSMVMAETPFLVALLLLLLLVDRWDQESKVWTGTGLGVILLSGGLLWLKEAGIGVVAGLVLWLLLKPQGPGRVHRIKRPLAVGVGVVVLLLPVVVARLIAGVPALTGSRYSTELGTYYHGNLIHRLVHVLPHSGWHLLVTAIPATLIPYLSPLPVAGSDSDPGKFLSLLATVMILVGAVVWFRRYRDCAVAIVPVYLLETVFWPEVNERRVILVLPVLAAWWAVGAVEIWRAVRAWSARRHMLSGSRFLAVALVLGIVVVPLGSQFPRAYLFNIGQSSSRFEGSRYADVLSHLGAPSDVVETDYLSSTALFTGHRTAWSAFLAATGLCYYPGLIGAIKQDNAAFLLVGDVNKPGILDSPCLLGYASSSPSAATRILYNSRDNASVFELIGPGTGHPDLADLTGPVGPADLSTGGSRVVEWDWGTSRVVDQVSLGQAQFADGSTSSVDVQLRQPDGDWQVVARATGPVGDGKGDIPYLLTTFPKGQTATAMRVVMSGTGSTSPLDIEDAHALGQ